MFLSFSSCSVTRNSVGKKRFSQKTQWLLVHTRYYRADLVSFCSEAPTLPALLLLQGL